MGWNRVQQTSAHPPVAGIADQDYFYFVHSYYASRHSGSCRYTTEYGHMFASAVARDNIFATQFHPEKSASAGLQLYKNFVHWKP